MKKNLTRIFSLLLAAVTALSISAAPLAKKVKAPTAEKTVQLNAAGAKLQQKARAKSAVKTDVVVPQVRKSKTANVFRSALKNANVPVKAPYKVGRQVASQVSLWGSVVYSDNASMEAGLYTIPTADGQVFDLLVGGAAPEYGGVLVDNVYYTCEAFSFWGMTFISFVGYDIETGETVYNQDGEYQVFSMSYDKTTSTVYGISLMEDGYALVKISFDDELGFEPVAIIAKPADIPAGEVYGWNSMACDADGQIYAIAYAGESGNSFIPTGSWLYKVSKTGELTLVGSTGEKPAYMSDCTFDTVTGKLFWTLSPADETGWLCEINKATGAATRVFQYTYAEEICGLVSPSPAAADNAPAAVEDLKIEFTEGALTGTVSFKAPSTLFDGTAASGDLTYTVLANDEKVATGSTTFGAAVNAEVTLESGMYTFVVSVSNAAGESPKTKVKNIFVGKDAPVAPSVTATYDAQSNTATVTWTPVTASVNGGYMNADAVTYDVTRNPGAVVLATGTT
ncbi:MAG: hypothetical protein K2L14_07595, partial [Duncaniella sp.]|nr:hypothetical protein [Duncaniella sp.]